MAALPIMRSTHDCSDDRDEHPARLTMCPGVVRYRCAGGNGTEVARPATRGRSGEHKPNSHGRAGLPPRSLVRMGTHNPNALPIFPYDIGSKVVHALSAII